MMMYLSTTDDLEIITELIEDTCHWEEHQRDIHPELREIQIMSDPGLVSDHDDDIYES